MSSLRPSPARATTWLLILLIAALYVITARLGLTLAMPPENKATAVWPPSGIALAALLLAGRRVWPGIWVGAFLANLWDAVSPATPFFAGGASGRVGGDCGWLDVASDRGAWEQLEFYLRNNTEATFSHGICPECLERR